MAPLGIAEDTQGSIRVPAALCGICGFRPTTGRYPTAGTAPITPLFDQIGPHARAVADLALFDAVMTGDARPIVPAALKGLRLGIARDYYFAGIDPEVARVIEAAMARLRDAGVVLVEAPTPALSKRITSRDSARASATAGSQLSSVPVKCCRHSSGVPEALPKRR